METNEIVPINRGKHSHKRRKWREVANKLSGSMSPCVCPYIEILTMSTYRPQVLLYDLIQKQSTMCLFSQTTTCATRNHVWTMERVRTTTIVLSASVRLVTVAPHAKVRLTHVYPMNRYALSTVKKWNRDIVMSSAMDNIVNRSIFFTLRNAARSSDS